MTSTSTPVHFLDDIAETDRIVIPNCKYYSKYDVRLRSIELANARALKTSSSQTIERSFSRHSASQVYLPRCACTMTGVAKGVNTNPVSM